MTCRLASSSQTSGSPVVDAAIRRHCAERIDVGRCHNGSVARFAPLVSKHGRRALDDSRMQQSVAPSRRSSAAPWIVPLQHDRAES